MFTVLGFLAQVCVICVSIVLFVDMHSVVSAEHDALVSAASLPQSSIVNDVDEPDATLTIASSCAKFMTSTAITTTVNEPERPVYVNHAGEVIPYPDDIHSLTVKQLKAYAKLVGFSRYSSLRKHELFEMLFVA